MKTKSFNDHTIAGMKIVAETVKGIYDTYERNGEPDDKILWRIKLYIEKLCTNLSGIEE